MNALPTDALPLVALAFVLGAKHGLDADHLVAIDGLTRFNSSERPGLARWCGVLFSLGHGAVVVAVALVIGALFALSFDAVSQAALFALTASQISNAALSVGAATAFMVGMVIADGVNGLWIATLLRNADRRARIATRVMGLAVAGLSLGVAVLGVTMLVSTEVEQWLDGRELETGLAVVAAVAASFVLAVVLSRCFAAKPRSQATV